MSVSSAPTGSGSSVLSSGSFFNEFAEKRSWEPGWLVDFRRENWEKPKACPQTPKMIVGASPPRLASGIRKSPGLLNPRTALLSIAPIKQE